MNNKKGGVGAKILLVLILMLASAVGGAYGYRVLDGKMAVSDALKAVENVDISDYDTEEQVVIQGYIDDAKKDLEGAKTRKEVYEIISEFIANVDKVQTKSEKQLEAALKEAEEAKNRYNNQNQNNSSDSSTGSGSYSTDNGSSTGSNASSNSSTGNDSSTGNGSSTDSDSSSNYKSNDLSTPADEEEESGSGFLGSLLGGLSSGASE